MNRKYPTFQVAIEEAIREEMLLDENIILLGESILSASTREETLQKLGRQFPERIVNNVPLIEEMLPNIALGMSIGGLKSIIQINESAFLTLLVDGIYRLGIWRFHTMDECNEPSVVIRVGHMGFLSVGAEIGVSLLALVFHLPNIWIAVPSSPYYAKGLLKSAIRAHRPVLFFEHKLLYDMKKGEGVPSGEYIVPFGTSVILRQGKDLTFVSWGFMSHIAMKVAEDLAREKIDVEVISLETLYPMDTKTIFTSVKKTLRIIIAEEDMRRGGIGAEIAALVAEKIPKCYIHRVGAKNVPIPKGNVYQRYVLPSSDEITQICKNFLNKTH